MNIFFGKISNKYDTNQITEGFYKAPKGSSWFGDIDFQINNRFNYSFF